MFGKASSARPLIFFVPLLPPTKGNTAMRKRTPNAEIELARVRVSLVQIVQMKHSIRLAEEEEGESEKGSVSVLERKRVDIP